MDILFNLFAQLFGVMLLPLILFIGFGVMVGIKPDIIVKLFLNLFGAVIRTAFAVLVLTIKLIGACASSAAQPAMRKQAARNYRQAREEN